MLDHLYVDGTDLTTFGGYYFDGYTRNAPVREYTFYDIPGRNGSGLGPTSRLKNIEIAYDFIIDSEANLRSLRSFLMSREGYVRIEDSAHTTEYRMGVFEGPLDVASTKDRDQHKGTIVFNCRPQRWLKSGETATNITSAVPTSNPAQAHTSSQCVTFTNPSSFPSTPFLRIYGYGMLFIDQDAGNPLGIVVTDYSADYPTLSYIDIDCETMNAYNGDRNMNKYVSFRRLESLSHYSVNTAGFDAPKFLPGDTDVFFCNALSTTSFNYITKVEVTPRWWEV